MNTKKIRIGLIGATGNMGSAICKAASQHPACEITAGFHRACPPDPAAPVDLFLDVSAPSALSQNLRAALLAKKPLIVGTTGSIHLEMLKEGAAFIPIFYSPNFSLGMTLMRRAAAEFARKFSHSADIDLIEMHRSKKQDAPSGSALMLAETIRSLCEASVRIHSIRSGSLSGEHTLQFNTDDERLTLTHEAHHRGGFARGALAAALFIASKPPGWYGMDDLIEDETNFLAWKRAERSS